MPALADMPEPEKTTTRLAPAHAAARRAAAPTPFPSAVLEC